MLKNYKFLWAVITLLILLFIIVFISQNRQKGELLQAVNSINIEVEKLSEEYDSLADVFRILNESDTFLAANQTDKARNVLHAAEIDSRIKSQRFRIFSLFDSLIYKNSDFVRENVQLNEQKSIHRRNYESISAQKNEVIGRLQELLSQSRAETDSLMSFIKNTDDKPAKSLILSEILRIMTIVNSKGNEIYYLGEKSNGMANGQGSGLWKKGGHYTGEWKDNNRHGKGSYFWADGESYEGDFVMDKREGFGKYIWKNGIYFIGNWKGDKRHGEGELFE